LALVRLFVYGSLRRGHTHHGQLHGARFVAVARTLPEHALGELDGYPLLLTGNQAVEGELFELDASALTTLDAFEGPSYRRGEVRLANGERAIAYLARFIYVHRR
jgi:gamma-glutamylcyclotransferase (GGCT)/AIG2-like uncharacterized protein YtfP